MTTTPPSAALTGDQPVPVASKPSRYHPVVVALHWLIAILIFSTAFLAQGDGEGGRREFRPGSTPPAGFQPGVPPSGFRPSEAANSSSIIDIQADLDSG